MYRLTLNVDLFTEDPDARMKIRRLLSDVWEAVGKNDAECDYYDVEWLSNEQDEPDWHCWCGQKATHINPTSDAGVAHPVCEAHVKDGYVSFEQQDEVEELLDEM